MVVILIIGLIIALHKLYKCKKEIDSYIELIEDIKKEIKKNRLSYE